MPKFRKKPVEIEARQYRGDDRGAYDIQAWVNTNGGQASVTLGGIDPGCMNIRTLEGVMRANPSDWVIRGVKGEFYPCRDVIFAATYDAVSDD